MDQSMGRLDRVLRTGLTVDVLFDTVCPWCFIGKRRFEQALALRPQITPQVRWRPFMLNPDMPAEGMDRLVYLERKMGSRHRVRRMLEAVDGAGRSVGLRFDLNRIQVTPNTMQSHRLVRHAAGHGLQSQTVEAVLAAYFQQGRDIGDLEVLVELAERVGLDPDAARRYLLSGRDAATIQQENARAHRLGVNGAPCFIFNGEHALAGAQEPEILVRMLDLAAETAPLPVSMA